MGNPEQPKPTPEAVPRIEGDRMVYASWKELVDWIGKTRTPEDGQRAVNSLLQDGDISINTITPQKGFDEKGNLVIDNDQKLTLSYTQGVLKDGIPDDKAIITTPILYPSEKTRLDTATEAQLIEERTELLKYLQTLSAGTENLRSSLIPYVMLSETLKTERNDSKYAAKLMVDTAEEWLKGALNEQLIIDGKQPKGLERNKLRIILPIIDLYKKDGSVNGEVARDAKDMLKNEVDNLELELANRIDEMQRELARYEGLVARTPKPLEPEERVHRELRLKYPAPKKVV